MRQLPGLVGLPQFDARLNADTRQACRTCGLPAVDHEVNSRTGEVRLKASVRAVVGNRLPPLCWSRERARFSDIYNRKPFMQRVGGRKVA